MQANEWMHLSCNMLRLTDAIYNDKVDVSMLESTLLCGCNNWILSTLSNHHQPFKRKHYKRVILHRRIKLIAPLWWIKYVRNREVGITRCKIHIISQRNHNHKPPPKLMILLGFTTTLFPNEFWWVTGDRPSVSINGSQDHHGYQNLHENNGVNIQLLSPCK